MSCRVLAADAASGPTPQKSSKTGSVSFDTRSRRRYGAHYRLSVYEDCKPCPTEYACQYTVELGDGEFDCSEPLGPDQLLRYKFCLEEKRIWTCVNASWPFDTVAPQGRHCENLVTGGNYSGGPIVNVTDVGPGVRKFLMPDRATCARMPFYCRSRAHAPFRWAELPTDFDRAYLAPAAEIANAAVDRLIELEDEVGTTLLCKDEERGVEGVDGYGARGVAIPEPVPGIGMCAAPDAENTPGVRRPGRKYASRYVRANRGNPRKIRRRRRDASPWKTGPTPYPRRSTRRALRTESSLWTTLWTTSAP